MKDLAAVEVIRTCVDEGEAVTKLKAIFDGKNSSQENNVSDAQERLCSPEVLYNAIVRGSATLVRVCVSYNANVNAVVDGFPLLLAACRLGFEDVVEELLLSPTVSYDVTTQDDIFHVGTVPMYVSGGRNALHVAVENHAADTVELLLTSERVPREALILMLQGSDNDGLTPSMLARMQKFPKLQQRLREAEEAVGLEATASPSEVDTDEKRVYVNAMRRRIEEVLRLRKAEEALAKQQQDAKLGVTDAKESPFADITAPLISQMSLPKIEFTKGLVAMNWRDTVHEICPGVYSVDLFRPEMLRELHTTLEGIEKRAKELSHDLSRPNSMNRYGFVLEQVGLGPWVKAFANTVLAQLCAEYEEELSLPHEVPEDLTSQETFPLVHAFSIRYRVGEDTTLATHVDDSDFTFNICLGEEGFEGAELYFLDPLTGHLVARHRHAIGTAVVHRGKYPHGVNQLTTGSRFNLVVWCKQITA